jgi:DNA repair photolyase
MEIDPKDSVDKKKEELSKLVDQYLESDIQEVVKYYRSKSEELVNTVKEYEVKLENLKLVEKRLELRERVEKENSSVPQEDIDLD